MTDQQHPITPLAQLVREWTQEVIGTHFKPYGYSEFIATRAAQWGADQELEKCCEWLEKEREHLGWAYRLNPKTIRAARRPKPPELPTVMEILDLSGEIEDAGLGQIDLVRAALERWGHR